MRLYLVVCLLVVASCAFARPVPPQQLAHFGPFIGLPILPRDAAAPQDSPVKRFAAFLDTKVGWTSVDSDAAVNASRRAAGFSRDDNPTAQRDVSPAERDPFGMVWIKGSQAWSAGHRRELDVVSPSKRSPFGWLSSSGLSEISKWGGTWGSAYAPPNAEDKYAMHSKRSPFGWIDPKGPFNWGAGHRRDIVHHPPPSTWDNPGVPHKLSARAPFSMVRPADKERRSPFAWWTDAGRWIHRRSPFSLWLDTAKWAHRRDSNNASLEPRSPFGFWWPPSQWGPHRRSPFAWWGAAKWAHRSDSDEASLEQRSPFSMWFPGKWGPHRREADDRAQRLKERDVPAGGSTQLEKRTPFSCWWCATNWSGHGGRRDSKSLSKRQSRNSRPAHGDPDPGPIPRADGNGDRRDVEPLVERQEEDPDSGATRRADEGAELAERTEPGDPSIPPPDRREAAAQAAE